MRTANSVHFTLTKSTLAEASRQIAHSPFRATLKASNRDKRPSRCADRSIRTGWRQPRRNFAGKGQNLQGQDHSWPAKQAHESSRGSEESQPSAGSRGRRDPNSESPLWLRDRKSPVPAETLSASRRTSPRGPARFTDMATARPQSPLSTRKSRCRSRYH